MTALNVIVTAEHASIITDTRAAAPGRVFDVPKVMPIPNFRIAVATRGVMDDLSRAVAVICAYAFDFGSARAFLADCYGAVGLGGSEIVIAGYGDEGPAAFIISSLNTGGKVQDIPFALVTPTVSAEAFDEFAKDPVAGMPALMQLQARDNSSVGGFINVTQVGASVIETYTVGVLDSPIVRAPMAF